MKMPFARWPNFAACEAEQVRLNHSRESAKKICGAIQARAEKGTLFKSMQNIEILQKGPGKDLIIGGMASWDLVDPQNDWVTAEAQVNFLRKFFELPPDYREVSIDHTSFIIGKALLQYPERNPRYFSHVHEKGMYLIAKIRNDRLKRTAHYRSEILKGTYRMFSISGQPLEPIEKIMIGGRMVRKIYDIDPFEVAVCKEGFNPKADFDILKRKCPSCVEVFKKRFMDRGDSESVALDKAQKLYDRVYARLLKQGFFEKNGKPPKAWWDKCTAYVKRNNPNYTDAQIAGTCGHIFFEVAGGAGASFSKAFTLLDRYLSKRMTWEECMTAARKDPDIRDSRKFCAWLRWYGPHGQKKGQQSIVPGEGQSDETLFRAIFKHYFPDK